MTEPDFTIRTERPIRQAFETMCSKASWISFGKTDEDTVEIMGWKVKPDDDD